MEKCHFLSFGSNLSFLNVPAILKNKKQSKTEFCPRWSVLSSADAYSPDSGMLCSVCTVRLPPALKVGQSSWVKSVFLIFKLRSARASALALGV